MTIYNFFMYGSVFLFFLIGVLHICAAAIFRKNKDKYDQFVGEYQQAGLPLDLTTRVSGFMGFYANYQKLAFFIRLYRGVKMRFSKKEYVKQEAYDFVQGQPYEKITWMLELLNFYKVIYLLTAIFSVFLVVFSYVLN
ncbi:hypothetical protein [Pantoea cypripedii]|uniref:Universal stress protein B n=1 Tax=Pantoea cypripedii TaxID=55209 RepID=A0A1X1EVN1_PANCY|nr:hypothetical protein [Pantoea cypripedii]MBP2198280.1 hypothetical protein [Pantoea cypripedii]ORM94100.1 hypothetical protein HA50_12340 [Pantoea cypripedii]